MELRSVETRPPAFRRAANRISVLLAAEALRDVPTSPGRVTTPLGPADGPMVKRDSQMGDQMICSTQIAHTVIQMVAGPCWPNQNGPNGR